MTVSASPIANLPHAILPSHDEKTMKTEAEMHTTRKSSLGHAKSSLGLTKRSYLTEAEVESNYNYYSRSRALPMMMMIKRSINTEASIAAAEAASSAASSTTKEILHQIANSHPNTGMNAPKTYNAKQVGGLATIAGLTGIGLGSSAHAGMTKVPKHFVHHHHYSAHRNY